MFGTRQGSAPVRGRSILALSTLALLAFCCAPLLAYGSAAGFQYEDAPQTATGKSPSESNLSDGSSSTSGVGSSSGGSGSGGDGSSGAKSPDRVGGSSEKSGDAAGRNDTAGQQGSQAKAGKDALGSSQPLSSTAPGSDGGSSPLVPILIAILVLAAGSVAYVTIKRRRADAASADPSVSPEAS